MNEKTVFWCSIFHFPPKSSKIIPSPSLLGVRGNSGKYTPLPLIIIFLYPARRGIFKSISPFNLILSWFSGAKGGCCRVWCRRIDYPERNRLPEGKWRAYQASWSVWSYPWRYFYYSSYFRKVITFPKKAHRSILIFSRIFFKLGRMSKIWKISFRIRQFHGFI